MFQQIARRWLACWLALLAGMAFVPALAAGAQAHVERKAKTKVAPDYPELARKLSIAGTVKVEVVVTPQGSVRSTRVLGGHPLLVQSAVEAVRKWKFEPGPDETHGVVEFRFRPAD